jgi:RimJ/RimL family protein N-acetyltransferase
MNEINTSRLMLTPFSLVDLVLFVQDMLTDPRVVEFFYSYKEMKDLNQIHSKAIVDFWEHFEEGRRNYDLEVWAVREHDERNTFIGWCGLLHTELSGQYGGPELQYMIAGDAHGKGYATEIATAVLKNAKNQLGKITVIATVDIPNAASCKVLEKLNFNHIGQIEAYGSKDMYLYRKKLN